MGSACVRAVDLEGEFGTDHAHDPGLQATGSRPQVDFSACRCVRAPNRNEELEIYAPRRLDAQSNSLADSPHTDQVKEFPLDPELDEEVEVPERPPGAIAGRYRKARTGMTLPQEMVWAAHVSAPVTLHIYDVGTKTKVINSLLRPLGAGIFHTGVEIFGREWTFADTESGIGSGVFSSRPRRCDGHTYCESICMGKTATPETEVLELVYLLARIWRAETYSTLRNNCCHFCNELCQRLGVGCIPEWVLNLAGAGAAIAAAHDTTCCRQVAGNCAEQFCCGINGTGATSPTVLQINAFDAKPC